MTYIVRQRASKLRPGDMRPVGRPHPTEAAAKAWLERNVSAEARRDFDVVAG